MTVVLALRCADGLVLAADSQITDAARGVSYPAQKLHRLGRHAAWGGSGSRAVLTDVERLFTASPGAVVDAEEVGRALQERIVPVLRHHYDHFIERVPGEQGPGGSPATYVLAAGYRGDQPFIVDVDPHGLVGHYVEVGFHAIGSGAAMAQQAGALLAHFRMTERSVDHGLVAAVRVLDALDTSSPSVGGPIDLCRITPDGAEHLGADAVDAIRAHARRWIDLESRALDELFA